MIQLPIQHREVLKAASPRFTCKGGPANVDSEDLEGMKVSELKILCKEKGLRVTGNKSELIERIQQSSPNPKRVARDTTMDSDIDNAIDRLLDRHDRRKSKSAPKDTTETPETSIVEAEIIEEEGPAQEQSAKELILVDDEPEIEPDEEKQEHPVERQDGKPLKETEKKTKKKTEKESISPTRQFRITRLQVAAGFAAALILSATLWVFLQRDSSFTAQQVRYGDSIEFSIQQSTINIEGDDMVAILRDSISPSAFDQVCSEIDVDISGIGSLSVARGTDLDTVFPSDTEHRGAYSVYDAFGRVSLAAKQSLNHELDVDLQGKTWRENGIECSNAGWSYPENKLSMTTESWRHISDRSVIRTETDLEFTDSDGESTYVEATTFGTSILPGLGAIAPLLSIPLLPMDLQEFFGDTVLEEGASSSEDESWTWNVKKERNDPIHGYVYPISISNDEIEACFGYLRMDILVDPDIPWPVQQTADIRLDKSLATSQCSVFASAVSDAALPEGRLDMRMDMTVTSSSKGTNEIDWYDEYDSEPSPGDDRPTNAGKKDWASHMPDESDSRASLEQITTCLRASHPLSDAAKALDEGGYVWEATYSLNDEDWNLSWVDTQDKSGWIILDWIPDDQSCPIADSGDWGNDDPVSWDKSAIPSTLTLDYLENRLLNENRYAEVNEVMILDSQEERQYLGYRAVSGEIDDISDLLSSELSTGVVTVVLHSEWSSLDRTRDYTFDVAMDATSSRVIGWIQISTSSE